MAQRKNPNPPPPHERIERPTPSPAPPPKEKPWTPAARTSPLPPIDLHVPPPAVQRAAERLRVDVYPDRVRLAGKIDGAAVVCTTEDLRITKVEIILSEPLRSGR